MTEKKKYEKPSMEVFELQQQQHLLAGSVGAVRDDYGTAVEGTWSARELLDFDEENAYME